MELVPWRPFRELGTLRKEMDRLREPFSAVAPFAGLGSEEWLPSADISETKDKLLIKLDLPGLETKDVNVSVSGDILTIKGEKRKEEEEKDENYYHCERYCGSFQRSFRLPANIQSDKVEASFDKGVLKITLPRTEQAKKKEIEVKVK